VDGVKNGLESGIDCGGVCPFCDYCFDGVKNFDEEGIDCGGSCSICPSCFDGERNQGEDGVDCGGPCKKCKSFLEMTKIVCERRIPILNPYFILFVALVVAVILAGYVLYRRKMKKMALQGKLGDIKGATAYYGVQRRMYLFLTSTTFVAIILLLYYYFIGSCYEFSMRYLWVLLFMLIGTPVIIHYVMKIFEYDEKRHLRRIRLLHDTHYQEIMRLMRIENTHVRELEETVASHLFTIEHTPGIRERVDAVPEFHKIYRELLLLIDAYKSKSMPVSEEKSLCDSVKTVTEKPEFKALQDEVKEVGYVAEKLSLILKLYVEKQGLYDEMEKLENPEKYEEFEDEIPSRPAGGGESPSSGSDSSADNNSSADNKDSKSGDSSSVSSGNGGSEKK
jgi:hypothetical protein